VHAHRMQRSATALDGAMHACSFNGQCKKIKKEVGLHGKPVDAKDNYIVLDGGRMHTACKGQLQLWTVACMYVHLMLDSCMHLCVLCNAYAEPCIELPAMAFMEAVLYVGHGGTLSSKP